MRTKKEIEEERFAYRKEEDASPRLSLEVLLDIRDLLASRSEATEGQSMGQKGNQ